MFSAHSIYTNVISPFKHVIVIKPILPATELSKTSFNYNSNLGLVLAGT